MLASLLDLLFPPRESERLLRRIPEDGLLPFLEPRVIFSDAGEITSLLPYEHLLVQAAVIEAKFHGNHHAARMLGNVLADYLRESLIEYGQFEKGRFVLIPVPLSRVRRRSRGYNQADVIVQYAAATLKDISVGGSLLVRARDTIPQTSLGGVARRKNMRGAFAVRKVPNPDTTYVVVDDVVTTGTTLCEVMRMLKGAGARRVWGVGVAH